MIECHFLPKIDDWREPRRRLDGERTNALDPLVRRALGECR
jgi:hypothetical protein